jgi:hypothetical protein
MRGALRAYHRSDVRGLDNIPDGPSLLVGNHSGGTVIVDTFVFATEFYAHFGPERRFHQLAHDVAVRVPGTGIRRFGTLAANHDNARAAFKRDAPVLVYPGGDYETFRPSWHSNRIEFGGRKGWIRLALEEGVPIVRSSRSAARRPRCSSPAASAPRSCWASTGWPASRCSPSASPAVRRNVLDMPGRLPLPAKITLDVRKPIDLAKRFGADPDLDEVYDTITRRDAGRPERPRRRAHAAARRLSAALILPSAARSVSVRTRLPRARASHATRIDTPVAATVPSGSTMSFSTVMLERPSAAIRATTSTLPWSRRTSWR